MDIVLFLEQEPEEIPSDSQPCGRGVLWIGPALLCVSSWSDWEKRGSAHPGRAESHGAIHRRVSEGPSVKPKAGPAVFKWHYECRFVVNMGFILTFE